MFTALCRLSVLHHTNTDFTKCLPQAESVLKNILDLSTTKRCEILLLVLSGCICYGNWFANGTTFSQTNVGGWEWRKDEAKPRERRQKSRSTERSPLLRLKRDTDPVGTWIEESSERKLVYLIMHVSQSKR